MLDIENNITHLQQRIADYEKKYARPPHSVRLLAVSKKVSVENILRAYSAGIAAFGENYLQEALLKINTLQDKNIEWHFIGSIQTNKIKKIAAHFAWVHSVADIDTAKRLNDYRADNQEKLNICLEVNISHEPSKAGIFADQVLALAQFCAGLPRLNLRGLMTVPAPHNDFLAQKNAFHQLQQLWDFLLEKGLRLDTLSMGMSDDFEAAIAEGSTLVRIGSAIFGPR